MRLRFELNPHLSVEGNSHGPRSVVPSSTPNCIFTQFWSSP